MGYCLGTGFGRESVSAGTGFGPESVSAGTGFGPESVSAGTGFWPESVSAIWAFRNMEMPDGTGLGFPEFGNARCDPI